MTTFYSVEDFERHAKKCIRKDVLDYFNGGYGQEKTQLQNKKSYSSYKIRPRYLKGIKKIVMSTTILGNKVSIPLGISPTAYHTLAHKDGECGTARAAEKSGTIFILSTHSIHSLEEVAASAPNAIKWLQFYIFKEREVNKRLIRRAEKNNFKAFVVTVDAPKFQDSIQTKRNTFQYPTIKQLGNLKDYGDLIPCAETLVNNCADWDDIKWLKSLTKLPIVVKGVLSAEDAILAVDAGADAILVSNHGGRQFDESLSTLDVLPEIVAAVGDKVEVYVDGGIRDGTDVFKALALGAKMVFVGRPILWGLACKGQEGVSDVLNLLRNEFEWALTMAGCSTLNQITPKMITNKHIENKL